MDCPACNRPAARAYTLGLPHWVCDRVIHGKNSVSIITGSWLVKTILTKMPGKKVVVEYQQGDEFRAWLYSLRVALFPPRDE